VGRNGIRGVRERVFCARQVRILRGKKNGRTWSYCGAIIIQVLRWISIETERREPVLAEQINIMQ